MNKVKIKCIPRKALEICWSKGCPSYSLLLLDAGSQLGTPWICTFPLKNYANLNYVWILYTFHHLSTDSFLIHHYFLSVIIS